MRQQIARIFAIVDRRTKLGLVGLFGLMLLSTVLETIGVGIFLPLLQILIDPSAVNRIQLIGPLLSEAAARDVRAFLIAICGAALIVFAVKSAVMAVSLFLQNRFVLRKQAAFGRDLLRAYLERPYVFHLQHNTAQLINNIENLSVGLFVKGLLPVMQLAMELMVGAGILLLLMAVNPLVTVGAVVVLGGAIALFYRLIQARIRGWGEQKIRYDGEILQWIQQALGSVKTTKLMGSQGFFTDAVAVRGFARARVLSRLNTAPTLSRLFIEVTAVAGLLLLVVTSLAAENGVSSILPVIGLYGAAAARLMPGFSKIVSSLTTLRENTTTIDILYRDLSGKPPPGPAPVAPRRAAGRAFARELRLDGIRFSYPDGAPVVDGIDLTIRPGESVAFVGRSGAGKTTLADIILGLLEPTAGCVMIDGADLRGKTKEWQLRVGYVPQDIYLLDDTLRRNIALGLPDAAIEAEKVARAVQLAHLEAVVAGLPQGLDTVIGERGARLSGGQRQRIGIARALYNDPDLLIMDEATSALDGETERQIGEAVLGLRAGPTVIIIAHRLTTVRHCDRLIFLESGKIADAGTFEELVKRNAGFRRLAGTALEMPLS